MHLVCYGSPWQIVVHPGYKSTPHCLKRSARPLLLGWAWTHWEHQFIEQFPEISLNLRTAGNRKKSDGSAFLMIPPKDTTNSPRSAEVSCGPICADADHGHIPHSTDPPAPVVHNVTTLVVVAYWVMRYRCHTYRVQCQRWSN